MSDGPPGTPPAAGRLWGPDFPLSEKDVSAIHASSLTLLGRTGLRFASQPALELFRHRGFRVEDQRVLFTEKELERALATVPRRFTIAARNPARSVRMEPGCVVFGLGRGAVTLVEPDGSYRNGRRQDLIDAAKLCQSLPVIELGGHFIYPSDLEAANTHLWMCQTMLKYTDKPYSYTHRDAIDLVALTDSPLCDFQAGAQAMLHTLHVLQNGPNFLPGCGLLGSYLGASLAKIVLDAELIAYTKRFLTPITPDALAVEVIAETGPGGTFISHEHTLAHYASEFLNHGIFRSTNYDQWAAQGSKEAVEIAHEQALELIDTFERPPMDPALEAEIDAYVDRHWVGGG